MCCGTCSHNDRNHALHHMSLSYILPCPIRVSSRPASSLGDPQPNVPRACCWTLTLPREVHPPRSPRLTDFPSWTLCRSGHSCSVEMNERSPGPGSQPALLPPRDLDEFPHLSTEGPTLTSPPPPASGISWRPMNQHCSREKPKALLRYKKEKQNNSPAGMAQWTECHPMD